jgi:hypothetical protein
MRKTLTFTLAVALLGIFAAVVVAAVGPSGDSATTPAATTTEERTTTEREAKRRDDVAVGDISGPCDEAEHANDPRCTGATAPTAPAGAPVQPGVDVSGPCDEAEHANDPRCAGGGARVDNSGPGSFGSGRNDDDADDDHNGSAHGDDDSSGSGHGGDDD